MLYKRIILILLVFASLRHLYSSEPEGSRACVLFFNDLHGNVMPVITEENGKKSQAGGLARIAELIKNIRSENDQKNIKTFVLYAGDLLQGSPFSLIFRGLPEISCFNKIKINAFTPGNHDFDFGLSQFLKLKQKASFPFISSNIFYKKNNKLLTDGSTVLKLKKDSFITVIGVTTVLLKTLTNPSNVSKLTVLDPVAGINAEQGKARKNGPVIILSHCGWKNDAEIARKIPSLLAVIGGHDHILMDPVKKIGDVYLFQAYEKGSCLGRIDLNVDDKTGKGEIKNWSYLKVTEEISSEPEIEAEIRKYNSKLNKKYKKVIGETLYFLDGERERIRYEETNLGDFIADSIRESVRSSVALVNGGSIRSGIAKGKITIEDIYRAVPFENEILVTEVSGSELKDILKRGYRSEKKDEDGGFLHISGIRVKLKNFELQNIEFTERGMVFDENARYQIALTDFMAKGGDGYDMLVNKKYVYTGLIMRDLLADRIRRKKIIDCRADGRILRIK